MQYSYSLQGKQDNYLYIGCTYDLKKKLELHHSDKVRLTAKRLSLTFDIL